MLIINLKSIILKKKRIIFIKLFYLNKLFSVIFFNFDNILKLKKQKYCHLCLYVYILTILV